MNSLSNIFYINESSIFRYTVSNFKISNFKILHNLTAKTELDSSNQEMLSRGPVRGQLFQKAKVKSLRMTALIVLAFIICWSPYYVLNILMAFFLHVTAEHEKAVIWIFFFGFANSMVNPMIYGAFHMCARRKKRFVSFHSCVNVFTIWYRDAKSRSHVFHIVRNCGLEII